MTNTSETKRLVITVGSSPMTTLTALCHFDPSEQVVFIHGGGETKAIAERAQRILEGKSSDVKVLLLEVDPFVPAEINMTLSRHWSDLESSVLVWGGGTAPMNVLVYASWLARPGNDEQVAWYLNRDKYFSNGNEGPVSPNTSVGFEELLAAHGFNKLPAKKNTAEADRRASLNDSFRRYLNCQTTKESEKVEGAYSGVGGILLEDAVFERLASLASDGVEKGSGLKVRRADSKSQDNDAEIDGYFWDGRAFLAVSCSAQSSVAQLKHKYFEVKERAEQLGGKEARSLTVVHLRKQVASGQRPARANEIRKKVVADWTQRVSDLRHALVYSYELFADDSPTVVGWSPTKEELSRAIDPQLLQWLRVMLPGFPADLKG